jgi:hypothetical protein
MVSPLVLFLLRKSAFRDIADHYPAYHNSTLSSAKQIHPLPRYLPPQKYHHVPPTRNRRSSVSSARASILARIGTIYWWRCGW